jgi:hypothetical protein
LRNKANSADVKKPLDKLAALFNKLDFDKIGENETSFRKSKDGKPISFIGFTYQLSKNNWLSKKKVP